MNGWPFDEGLAILFPLQFQASGSADDSRRGRILGSCLARNIQDDKCGFVCLRPARDVETTGLEEGVSGFVYPVILLKVIHSTRSGCKRGKEGGGSEKGLLVFCPCLFSSAGLAAPQKAPYLLKTVESLVFDKMSKGCHWPPPDGGKST